MRKLVSIQTDTSGIFFPQKINMYTTQFILLFASLQYFPIQYWDTKIAEIAQYFANTCPGPNEEDENREVPGLFFYAFLSLLGITNDCLMDMLGQEITPCVKFRKHFEMRQCQKSFNMEVYENFLFKLKF